jgi:hypothetical protein
MDRAGAIALVAKLQTITLARGATAAEAESARRRAVILTAQFRIRPEELIGGPVAELDAPPPRPTGRFKPTGEDDDRPTPGFVAYA